MIRATKPLLLVAAAVAALGLAAGTVVAAPLEEPPFQASPALVGSEGSLVTTWIHNSQHEVVTTVPVGTPIHVIVAVAGFSGTPTGGLSVRVWTNGTCSGTQSESHVTSPLVNGDYDGGPILTPSQGGPMSVKVIYQGDATYGVQPGPCRSLSVTKLNPGLVARLHTAQHEVETDVFVMTHNHVNVDVSGRAGTPVGSVFINRWKNETCDGTPAAIDEQLLSNGEAESGDWFWAAIGLASYRVSYTGDATYNARTSACVQFDVAKHPTTLAAEIHRAGSHEPAVRVPVGTVVHAAATLSSGYGTPTGTVLVERFSDDDCQVSIFVEPIDAAPTMDAAGSPLSYSQPGLAYFRLKYLGDAIHAPTSSACLKVRWREIPTVGLTVHDGDHDAITTAVVGTRLHPRVTVIADSDNLAGEFAVWFYKNGSCSGGGTAIASKDVANGVLHDTDISRKPSTAGSYSFKAEFGGNPTLEPATSPCVAVTLTAPPPPDPTAAPGPTAAPKPTAGPIATATAQPTAHPEPTNAPEPSAAPSQPATADPGATVAPTSQVAGSTADPGTGPSPSAGAAIESPAVPGQAAAGSTTQGGDGGLGSIFAGLIVLLLLGAVCFVAGTAFARRRKPRPAEAAR